MFSPCSVREWIQCMQVCCQSCTTHSSPPTAVIATTQPPSLSYRYNSTLMTGHTHQTHPLLQYPSHWTAPDCYAPVVTPSSVLVDTGYVSAESSPTYLPHTAVVSLTSCYKCHRMMFALSHMQECPKVELVPTHPALPSLIFPHTWVTFHQSGLVASRSRL